MLDKPDEVRSAVATIAQARLTVWNARLELAMKMGDARKIDSLLAADAGSGGSGCNCGCGGGGGQGSGCSAARTTFGDEA